MQLTHPTTGATKTLPDDTSDEDIAKYTDGGWQVSIAPKDKDSDGESADKSSGSSKSGGKKKAKSAEKADTTVPVTQDEVDVGHSGLKEDKGATTAETGSDPA